MSVCSFASLMGLYKKVDVEMIHVAVHVQLKFNLNTTHMQKVPKSD